MSGASRQLTSGFSATSPGEECISIGLLCGSTCRISVMPSVTWSSGARREEVHRIWMSVYTPQRGEQSAERLTMEDRKRLAEAIPGLARKYPKFLIKSGMARSHPRAAIQPRAVHICACVGKLHSGPAHAREALRVRRRSGLLGMRLRHQLRAALDHERKGRADRSAACAGCVVENWRGGGEAEEGELAVSRLLTARGSAAMR